MPSLYELSDAAQPSYTGLPVQQPFEPNKAAAIGIRPLTDTTIPVREEVKPAEKPVLERIADRLLGLNGEERYQLWPEKVIRSAISAPHDVMTEGTHGFGLRREDVTDIPPPDMPNEDSTWLGKLLNLPPVASDPSDYLVGKAFDMSALAGSGGLAGTTDATLGAGPFLRPALKYENKIYKAPVNGQHLDALPSHLADEFQRQAMSGEDISNFNFGFMNHKGQFLSREAALDYAIKEGLIDPSAGQYGTLTSTLLADSSKPGTAIEAMAKTQDAYHGTPTPGFSRFNTPNPAEYMPDRALGTHVSKDPEIANTFTKDNGAVYPVKIPHDEKFYQVKQDLLPYIEDKTTPKNARNVGSDQNAIEHEIYRVAYRKDPEMFARFLQARWNMAQPEAEAAAKNILAGVPQKLMGRPVKGLDDYIAHDGTVKAWNDADKAAAVNMFKKEMQDKGYAGVKYINTSPMETANAKDHSSYIVFDPSKHIQSKFTNTLMADSSKPGTAIEAMAKSREPFLNAAVKVNDKLYKGVDHLDALSKVPAELKAQAQLDGNNRGWVNDRGRFLNREKAQKYAVDNGLIKDNAPSWVHKSPEAIAEWIKQPSLKSDNEAGLSASALAHIEQRAAEFKNYGANDYHAEQQGYMPQDWYHGSIRSDRVVETGKINPKRATSGPMPYFTDDPEMASSYAMGKKPDTSLSKFDDASSVAPYFTVSPKDLGYTRARTPMTVEQSYYHLKPEQKAEILEKYHRIGYENRDMGEGPYTLHNEPYSGLSGKDHYDWVLKHEAKGNPLTALRMIWHDGGSLIGQEGDLSQIFKMAGYPHKISEATAPWTEARGVMPAKLRIQSPLVTENKEELLNKVIPHLEQAFKGDRSRTKDFGADMWDKEHRYTPKAWVNQLKEDLAKGENSYVWTSIPDKVTKALKQIGYDGIIDTGGKGGGQGHTVAIPFHPDQVRSKFANFNPNKVGKDGLLLADSSKEGSAIASVKQAQPFYSAVEHQVNQITQPKMTGDQWLGTLANKPGVKPEELDWTGLKDFLQERGKQPVTKQEVQSFVQANKVELKEVDKGNPPNLKEETDDLYNNLSGTDTYPKNSATKYHSYQLPGGENYREKLLTLPAKGPEFDLGNQAAALSKSLRERYGERWLTEAPANEVMKYDILINQAEKASKQDYYKSSHWDEPNILAHVRMNDRTMAEPGYRITNLKSGNTSQTFPTYEEALTYANSLPENIKKNIQINEGISPKKSLHLEEIQSDWHQQGRDKGYNVKNVSHEVVPVEGGFKIKAADGRIFGMGGKEDLPYASKEAAQKMVDIALKAAPELRHVGGVPDAPFKKSWHELALKRMIREAAEKGYDRLSWTPGEAQAARYDLSKSVSKLHYDPDLQGGTLAAEGLDGRTVLDKQNVKPDQIADFVGKEPAKKLLETKRNSDGIHSLEGVDLKIGGEGMKGFYDQIIPKALEKIGKEHGVKVKYNQLLHTEAEGYKLKSKDGKEYLESGTGFKIDDPATIAKFKEEYGKPIHYIDLPQSLKDQAMHKGFPLFSGGYQFIPVAGNPFNDKTRK